MIKVVEENEFKNAIKENLVIVDFFATWCGPCKMLSPVLEELSEEMKGKVKFIKVDVDQCSAIADKYGISNIPALVIFNNGEKQDMLVGFMPKDIIKSKLELYL